MKKHANEILDKLARMNTQKTVDPPARPSKEWIDHETQRISLAGQVTALQATGVNFLTANLDGTGSPILLEDEDPLWAGFSQHAIAKSYTIYAIEDHVRAASPTLARRMLIAQTRAILAGCSAMECADTTGALGFVKSELYKENASWAKDLLSAFAELLDIDEDTCGSLLWRVSLDASALIGSNWDAAKSTYTYLRTHGRYPVLTKPLPWDKISAKFPVEAEYANSLFDEAEESSLKKVRSSEE